MGFSPCLRTRQQPLLSGFCHSALYLQYLELSQAVTAQRERHFPPPGKVHKTLRHPVVTSLLSPSKTTSQELSQTSCSRKPPLPDELHCCCNQLQLIWSTYNQHGTKTKVPREHLLQSELEREQDQNWRGGDPTVHVHDMNCADKPQT